MAHRLEHDLITMPSSFFFDSSTTLAGNLGSDRDHSPSIVNRQEPENQKKQLMNFQYVHYKRDGHNITTTSLVNV